MKNYEIMTIAHSSLGESGALALSTAVKEIITSLDGKIVDAVPMGKRKFAYEIKGEKDGFYDVVKFELEKEKLLKLKEKLSRLNGLVRYLISAL